MGTGVGHPGSVQNSSICLIFQCLNNDGSLADVTSTRPEIEQALAHVLRGASWSSERLGHSFASSQGLHPTDFRALTAIVQAESTGRPMTVRRLVDELDLTPAAVTYAVDRLESAGHVRRERGERDRRTVVLRLAQHGRDVAVAFFTPFARVHTAALAEFSDAELATSLRVLQAVNAALVNFDASIRARDDAQESAS